MEHPIIESPALVCEPDEAEAFKLELLEFVKSVLDYHVRGLTIGQSRIVLARLAELFREETRGRQRAD
jgi:hypothetical protein